MFHVEHVQDIHIRMFHVEHLCKISLMGYKFAVDLPLGSEGHGCTQLCINRFIYMRLKISNQKFALCLNANSISRGFFSLCIFLYLRVAPLCLFTIS